MPVFYPRENKLNTKCRNNLFHTIPTFDCLNRNLRSIHFVWYRDIRCVYFEPKGPCRADASSIRVFSISNKSSEHRIERIFSNLMLRYVSYFMNLRRLKNVRFFAKMSE